MYNGKRWSVLQKQSAAHADGSWSFWYRRRLDRTAYLKDKALLKKDIKKYRAYAASWRFCFCVLRISKEGEYKVVYKVADDNGKEATREIKVTVTKNEEGKKPGIDIKHEEDNNKPGAIPKTGGTNVIYYIGIALILIAGGMYFTFKKKNIS